MTEIEKPETIEHLTERLYRRIVSFVDPDPAENLPERVNYVLRQNPRWLLDQVGRYLHGKNPDEVRKQLVTAPEEFELMNQLGRRDIRPAMLPILAARIIRLAMREREKEKKK